MHLPNQQQRAKERAVLYTSLADFAILLPMIVLGVATMSMTLLSEAVRVGLMLVVEIYTLIILRATHRNRLHHFRFGTYKLEQFCNLTIGAVLVGSGLWICNRVAVNVHAGELVATHLGLTLAAIANAVNTTINGLGWYSMAAAAQSPVSPIYAAQLRARRVKFFASAVVQVTITMAALAQDPLLALWFDGIGGAFVAVLQITIGARMIWESLPDLLDHAVPDPLRAQIHDRLLQTGIVSHSLRTRRAGARPQVELTIDPSTCNCLDDLHAHKNALHQSLNQDGDEMDLCVLVANPQR